MKLVKLEGYRQRESMGKHALAFILIALGAWFLGRFITEDVWHSVPYHIVMAIAVFSALFAILSSYIWIIFCFAEEVAPMGFPHWLQAASYCAAAVNAIVFKLTLLTNPFSHGANNSIIIYSASFTFIFMTAGIFFEGVRQKTHPLS